MKLLHPSSLAATIDAVNEALFVGKQIPPAERARTAAWIAGRQGKRGSYANMFAPTPRDFAGGIRVFTGEAVRSNAATAHILGEEASRALILLGVGKAEVRTALSHATAGMLARLRESESAGMSSRGFYCCAMCSCALWRHLGVGGLSGAEARLRGGVKILRTHRSGEGRWRRFPFYYTLLSLTELDLLAARRELRYAAPACERALKTVRGEERIAARRRVLLERVLAAH